jgi:hypothetical protein
MDFDPSSKPTKIHHFDLGSIFIDLGGVPILGLQIHGGEIHLVFFETFLIWCLIFQTFCIRSILDICRIINSIFPKELREIFDHCPSEFDKCLIHPFCHPILGRRIWCSFLDFYAMFTTP